MKRYAFLISFGIVLSLVSNASTIHVPGDYAAIQDAIDAALIGDTVIVAPGTYFENINFNGKEIVLTSSGGAEVTCIDGQDLGTVVIMTECEAPGTVLRGFTVQNGKAPIGAGIFCESSSPLIEFNTIKENETAPAGSPANGGGGIYCYMGEPVISHNRIYRNEASYCGGGIYVWEATVQIVNNVIFDNLLGNFLVGKPPNYHLFGGGICAFGCTVPDSRITNNVVYGNYMKWPGPFGSENGGGIYTNTDIPLTNTICWNNLNDVEVKGYSIPSYINHCNIQDEVTGWGVGNISTHPLFVNPLAMDFHLTVESPCIDAGYNMPHHETGVDLDGDKRLLDSDGDNSVIVDMGVDEFMMLRVVPDTISAATGGTNHFYLDAGPDDILRKYVILASLTGTEPGTVLPFGLVTLPLVWDLFTDFVWVYKNTPTFQDFFGTLGLYGEAHAQLNVGSLPPVSAGTVVYFAFTCNNMFDLASHPVELLVVP